MKETTVFPLRGEGDWCIVDDPSADGERYIDERFVVDGVPPFEGVPPVDPGSPLDFGFAYDPVFTVGVARPSRVSNALAPVERYEVRKGQLIGELVEIEHGMAELAARRAVVLAWLAEDADVEAGRSVGRVDPVAAFGPAKRRELERRSVVAEVACALRMPEGTVIRLMGEAECLVGELPGTLGALRAGRVSYRHVQVMVSHVGSVPVEARRGFEVAVLPEALVLTASRFDVRARRLREGLHPESIVVRSSAAREERCVRLEPARDGMAFLHHYLPAVDAHRIDDALTRFARAARGPGESRTGGQLRADALTDLVLRPAAAAGSTPGVSPVGEAAAPQPTVIVTVPISTLLGATDEPGVVAGYGPIDADTARRLAANAPSLLRMITDPVTGEMLSLGRTRYRPPRHVQLALQLDDETCRFPACSRRASGCEIDHTTAWEHGGTTDMSNLAHLCPKHHHLKHETRWRVRQLIGRELEWISPTGRVYTTAPARRAVASSSAAGCTCVAGSAHRGASRPPHHPDPPPF